MKYIAKICKIAGTAIAAVLTIGFLVGVPAQQLIVQNQALIDTVRTITLSETPDPIPAQPHDQPAKPLIVDSGEFFPEVQGMAEKTGRYTLFEVRETEEVPMAHVDVKAGEMIRDLQGAWFTPGQRLELKLVFTGFDDGTPRDVLDDAFVQRPAN